jgi:hypothetical protein
MRLKLVTPRFVFVTSAVLLAAASRLFPHIPNFTPIAAMALFGGVYFSDKRLAFVIPLLAMVLSDVGLQLLTGAGYHSTMVYVYIGFILTSFIGLMIRSKVSIMSVAAGSVISSVLFFLLTNFGYWATNGFQAGAAGLGTTYVMGIPFFGPTLAGDLFFNGIMFGAFYFAQRRIPAIAKI